MNSNIKKGQKYFSGTKSAFNFYQIIGHQRVWQFLKKSVEAEKISHAYLFFGPDRIGKKRVALEFIKLLNCQEINGPCQSCRSCKEIEKKSFADLILIEPEKKEISISQIRNLNWGLSLQSHSAAFKSALIDEAHLMNLEAQSALLKTLEEPKGRTVIILITAFPELLFPTIISRTERIRFLPVSQEEIKNYLKKQGVSEKKSEELISISLGKPGEIIEFLSYPQKLEERVQKIKDLKKMVDSPLSVRFQYAKEESQNPKVLIETLDIWLRYFRGSLFSVPEQRPNKYSLLKIKKIINLIQDINFLLSKTEVNPKLALEMILLEL